MELIAIWTFHMFWPLKCVALDCLRKECSCELQVCFGQERHVEAIIPIPSTLLRLPLRRHTCKSLDGGIVDVTPAHGEHATGETQTAANGLR